MTPPQKSAASPAQALPPTPSFEDVCDKLSELTDADKEATPNQASRTKQSRGGDFFKDDTVSAVLTDLAGNGPVLTIYVWRGLRRRASCLQVPTNPRSERAPPNRVECLSAKLPVLQMLQPRNAENETVGTRKYRQAGKM